MKKRMLAMISCVLILTMLMGMSVLAAPQTMSDGQLFDPDYYAAANADVVAVFGSDPQTLYQHYLKYGKAEGRLPYDVAYASATNTNMMVVNAGPTDPTELTNSAGYQAALALRTAADQQRGLMKFNFDNSIKYQSTEVKTALITPMVTMFESWKNSYLPYPSTAQVTSVTQAYLAPALSQPTLSPYYAVMVNQFIADTGVDASYITNNQCMAISISYRFMNARGVYETGTLNGVLVIPTGNIYTGDGTSYPSSVYLPLISLMYSGNAWITLP